MIDLKSIKAWCRDMNPNIPSETVEAIVDRAIAAESKLEAIENSIIDEWDIWKKAGGKVIRNEKTLKAARLINEIYKNHDIGGNCHLVVDDENIDTPSIMFCFKAIEHNYFNFPQSALDVEKEFLELFLFMSIPEKCSAIVMHDNGDFYGQTDNKYPDLRTVIYECREIVRRVATTDHEYELYAHLDMLWYDGFNGDIRYKPQRITAQDAREIASSFAVYTMDKNNTELDKALAEIFEWYRSDLFSALLAKLNEHREPDYKAHKWQPIETAPKDGTIIDMYGYHPTLDLQESYDYKSGFPRRFTDCRWNIFEQKWEKRWFNDVDDEMWTTDYQFMTHWMHKPNPPVMKS